MWKKQHSERIGYTQKCLLLYNCVYFRKFSGFAWGITFEFFLFNLRNMHWVGISLQAHKNFTAVQRNHGYTESEYILFFKCGEEIGFSFFFREYYAALCQFSFQITKSKEAAEEIAGEAFTKLWERRVNFDNVPSLKSFLYTVTRNSSLNWIRQQKRDSRRAKDLAYLTEEGESVIMQKLIEAEYYREIYLAINTLPPKCKKIFQMIFLEGKDYQQIADELHLSVNNIRVQKARAIALLKHRLALSLFVSTLLNHIA